jgi:hypothetical protein
MRRARQDTPDRVPLLDSRSVPMRSQPFLWPPTMSLVSLLPLPLGTPLPLPLGDPLSLPQLLPLLALALGTNSSLPRELPQFGDANQSHLQLLQLTLLLLLMAPLLLLPQLLPQLMALRALPLCRLHQIPLPPRLPLLLLPLPLSVKLLVLPQRKRRWLQHSLEALVEPLPLDIAPPLVALALVLLRTLVLLPEVLRLSTSKGMTVAVQVAVGSLT